MKLNKQRKVLIAGGIVILLLLLVGGYISYTTMNKEEETSIDKVLRDLDELIDYAGGDSELDPLTADQLGFDYQSEGIDQTVDENEWSIDDLNESIDITDLDAGDLGF